MSYEILRAMRLRDNRIFLEVASSNVVPRTFTEVEYHSEGSLDKQFVDLCYHMAAGNIKPMTSSGKPYRMYRAMQGLYELAPETSIEKDLDYQVTRHTELRELIAGLISPSFMNKRVDYDDAKRQVAAFDTESKRIYKAKQAEFIKGGIVVVQAAIISDLFPGYDVLAAGDECMLGKRERYDNRGHYDNSDGSLIYLGKGSGQHFHMLSSGAFMAEHRRKDPVVYQTIIEKIEAAGINPSVLIKEEVI